MCGISVPEGKRKNPVARDSQRHRKPHFSRFADKDRSSRQRRDAFIFRVRPYWRADGQVSPASALRRRVEARSTASNFKLPARPSAPEKFKTPPVRQTAAARLTCPSFKTMLKNGAESGAAGQLYSWITALAGGSGGAIGTGSGSSRGHGGALCCPPSHAEESSLNCGFIHGSGTPQTAAAFDR